MAGIKVPFLADIAQFLGRSKDVQRALEETADELDDVGQSGRDAGRQIEDAFRDAGSDVDRAGRDARDAGREVERAFEDAGREVRDWGTATDDAARDGVRGVDNVTDAVEDATREVRTFEDDIRAAFATVKTQAKSAGDTVDKETVDSFDRAGDTVGEFKDEARSNFSEVASSFTGEMDSAADIVQGTLGGLAGSLAGPASLAAGALAAVFGVMYTAAQENSEKAKEAVSAMYDDMKESGESYLSESYITQELDKIYSGAEDAAVKWEELGAIAKATGTDQATVARAYAGDLEAQEALLALISTKLEEVQTMDHPEAAQYMDEFGDILGDVQGDLTEAGSRAGEVKDRVRDMNAALLDVPDPNIAVTTSGIPEAEAAMNGATYDRWAQAYLGADYWQAQNAIDTVARQIRKPTITVNVNYAGMRAV